MVWSRSLFSHPLETSRWRPPYLLSLGSQGMGPRSLLREVLGELSHSLSLGTGSTGAVDLLLVLFKKKEKSANPRERKNLISRIVKMFSTENHKTYRKQKENRNV